MSRRYGLGLVLLLLSGCSSFGVIDGRPRRLLDEFDLVSSVSGGSFTSAYYALYGERIFEDFEDRFLRRNVQHQLIRGLLNPLEWFSSSGRTEMAVRLYEKEVFHGATLELMDKSVTRWAKDLSTPRRPVIPYFIQVSFRDIAQPEWRKFFNQVPTSFSLTDEQVDKLIAAGRELLRANPNYRRFVTGLGGGRTARR